MYWAVFALLKVYYYNLIFITKVCQEVIITSKPDVKILFDKKVHFNLN